MNFWFGTINTAVLICSSLTMALAVRASQVGQKKIMVTLLIVTILFGCAFMVIKGFEYHEHWQARNLRATTSISTGATLTTWRCSSCCTGS